MDSTSFARRLPSASGTQSIYEAIKLHDQHPAGHVEGDGRDDALLDEENLDARFQEQDLDALLAEAGQIRSISEEDSRQEDRLPTVEKRQDTYSRSDTAPTPSEDVVVAPSSQIEDGDDVPASLLMEARDSESPPSARKDATRWPHRKPTGARAVPNETAMTGSGKQYTESGDVPSVLLTDNGEPPDVTLLRKLPPKPSDILPNPVPGPSRQSPRVRWDPLQERRPRSAISSNRMVQNVLYTDSGPIVTNPAERAMWMWANVENLDGFLAEIYEYFRGRGIWSILLSRLFEQLTLAFVVGFGTFLMSCIDYSKLPGSKALPEVVIPRCTSRMSGFSNFFLWLLSFFWLFKTLRIALSIRKYWAMHEFFTHLLHITENELQTITWQAIVSRLMNLRDANARTALDVNPRSRKFLGEQSKQRMDAHDIANRLMRRDNYLIALFNKDILNLTLPVPFLRNHQFFSRNLEWNLNLCILDYVFNESGEVSQLFLRDSHRSELIEGLRRRFQIMGFINILSAPFLVTYFLMLYFLRYFNEFQKNPSQIGSRSYTPLAEWKFREFNELYNFFERRLNISRPFANRYLDQFPKDKVSQSARFIAFVAGSLASVLGLVSLLDPDLFLGFEITKDRTVLFYLGIFGTIWAVARGLVAEDEDSVFDPEYAIEKVAEFTHFKPAYWQGRLHTEEVRKEFSQLYQTKIVIFLEEILSIVFTPFVLWFSLPDCSARIVDFFREFTVHVDGLGYVCSFALFEFQKEGIGKPTVGASTTLRAVSSGDNASSTDSIKPRTTVGDPRADYYATKDNKMLASYYNFIDSYANNPTGGGFNRYHDRRMFRPPPQFPGILNEEAKKKPASPIRQGSPYNRSAHTVTTTQQPRQSRMRHPLEDSVMTPSLLLDPSHQPPHSQFRPTRNGIRESLARSRGASKPLPSQHKDLPQQQNNPASSSVAIDEDSNLGDSWKTNKAGDEEDDSSRGPRNKLIRQIEGKAMTEDGTKGGNEAGVLGLLYEFQKAQTEGGRGTGVKI